MATGFLEGVGDWKEMKEPMSGVTLFQAEVLRQEGAWLSEDPPGGQLEQRVRGRGGEVGEPQGPLGGLGLLPCRKWELWACSDLRDDKTRLWFHRLFCLLGGEEAEGSQGGSRETWSCLGGSPGQVGPGGALEAVKMVGFWKYVEGGTGRICG